jgi:hypothetical protein
MSWLGGVPQNRIDKRTRRLSQILGRFDLLLGAYLYINPDGNIDIDTVALTDVFVPYTGALHDVDLGTHTLTTTGAVATGDLTVSATLILASGSITDTAGAISFGNENLSTTGTLSSGTHTIGTLVLTGASITDTTGAVSFDNENLITTGSLSVGTSFTANSTGGDNDTIIKGNTDNSLFYINAGDDRVGISTSTPDSTFEVAGEARFGTSATNYAQFKTDGELNLHGTARVTKLLPITRLFSNAGADVIDSCHYVYDLDPLADEGIAFITYIPSDFTSGTNVVIKFRWCPTVTNSDGVDRYVYWRGYHHTTGSSGTIGAGTIVNPFSSTVPDGEVAETIHENTFTTISGLSAGDALHFIIYREQGMLYTLLFIEMLIMQAMIMLVM